ncbi:hypothetical protein [Streptomyces sp. NPDC001292]|uniref:hypothetical protein n=1 Tax=Streptomyces sp. NPDC001292 TaxID=3364558 RepID=UPI00367DA60C
MGERLNGDGVPGCRRVHTDGASGPWDVRADSTLKTVQAAVMRGGDLDPEAEQRAVAAFLAARGAGAHRARTRRRDDWRLPAERTATTATATAPMSQGPPPDRPTASPRAPRSSVFAP